MRIRAIGLIIFTNLWVLTAQASGTEYTPDDFALTDGSSVPMATAVSQTGKSGAPSPVAMNRQQSTESIGNGARVLCCNCGTVAKSHRIEGRVDMRRKAFCRFHHKRYGEYALCLHEDGKTKPIVIDYREGCCNLKTPLTACWNVATCPCLLVAGCFVGIFKCLDSSVKYCKKTTKSICEGCYQCCNTCSSGSGSSNNDCCVICIVDSDNNNSSHCDSCGECNCPDCDGCDCSD